MIGNDSMFTSLGDPGDHDHVTYGDNTRERVAVLERITITKDFSFSNILYVESLNFNLLSVAQLCDFGLMCTFDKYGVIVFHEKDKSLMFKGFRYRYIYLVDFSKKEASSITCLFSKTSLGWICHRRITHIGMSNPKKAHKRGIITGLKDVTFDKNKLCSACQARKQVVIHLPLKTMLSTSKPLELLYMDLFGLTSYKSIGGNLYCLVIVDDYSHYIWTLFLGDKSETPEIFKTFVRGDQREYNSLIVKIRSDNGSEFNNMNIENWCGKESVKHEFFTTYTLNKMELLNARTRS
jgi:hypothetical protein